MRREAKGAFSRTDEASVYALSSISSRRAPPSNCSMKFVEFNYLFYHYVLNKFGAAEPGLPRQLALEYLTGFVIEKTLAIDNIFIFAVVFSYFGIPRIYQHRVLFWGIIGALIFRGAIIALGSVLMQYKAAVIFFGGLLILTGLKMFFAGTETQNLENNFYFGGYQYHQN